MTSQFQRALLEQILTSDARLAARRRRRRRVWGGLGGAVAAAFAAIVAVLSIGGSPATADVVVTVEDGRVTVALTALDSSPREVASALTAAGIDATVEPEPVGPSNVGVFVGVGASGGSPVELVRAEVRGQTFRSFSFPQSWHGRLRVAFGRPARAGEVYAVASDAFAVGEPLHCSGLEGTPLARAGDRLDGLDVRATVAPDPSPVPIGDLTVDQRALPILAAEAFGSDEIVLHLGPAGDQAKGAERC